MFEVQRKISIIKSEPLDQSSNKQVIELEAKRIASEEKAMRSSQGECSNGICQLNWKPDKKRPAA